MKKLKYIFILLVIFLVGCEMGNTPTAIVEELFIKYQSLDDTILEEINKIVNKKDLTEEQKKRYKKVLEKQYRNLTYEIKEEKIDGDIANVTTEIKVLDYKREIENLDINTYSLEEYNNLKLDLLENCKTTVTYTLELEFIKDKDNNWKLKALSNTNIKKIQGMY